MADQTFASTVLDLVGIIAQRSWTWKTAPGESWEALGYNAPQDPMSLIQAKDLSKSYGIQDVLQGISLVISRQARIAMVGPNGIGKSTLLRLLAGLESPDMGEISRARNIEVGYLPQEAIFSRSLDTSVTVWDHCQVAFQDLIQKQNRLSELEQSMADPEAVEDAMRQYGPLQEQFEREGGYTYEARIRQVLHGLGFSSDEFNKQLNLLSGGERTRAQLAHLLLLDPDLLILDEPTNHLDIEAVEWLEGWLRDWAGAVIIVSHDRYFIDRVVDTVWDLQAHGLEVYSGNYSAYVQQRSERKDLLEKRYKAQQEHIEKERDFIQRNIAGQNTRQAQGRRKRLERFLKEEAVNLSPKQRTARIQFSSPERSGDLVLRTYDLEIGHSDDQEPLFGVPDLILHRGERVALIGPNGAGKTTFLRTLLGEIAPKSGEVDLGASLQVGYFEQAHAGLDPQQRVFDSILEVAPYFKDGEARSYLAQFLFTGDDVFKYIEVLSGGERAKLALARLILQGANLLLLDEPTNHLDIPSQEALQSALDVFPGTVLLVSHDRYLIEALAEQVWVILPGERSLQVISGGYSAYVEHRQAQRTAEARPEQTNRKEVKRSFSKTPKVNLHKLEARIATLENELDGITAELEIFKNDVDKVLVLGERYAKVEQALDEALELWERAGRELSST
ncbi:MAG: ABC-F family ATP-binding cassette domain-containing protein [Anaerolineales bacterium]|jgi:ATP-binding cassette subfamily F protein 3